MNIQEDVRRQFAEWLSANGHSTEGNLRALVIRYQNVIRRVPPEVRWELRISKELVTRDLPQEIRDGLAYFMEQARNGASLRPFLSANIEDADYKDLMFYEWGIYHFHLGTALAQRGRRCGGFVKGTDDVLFAIADRDHPVMYLIDIHPHVGGFSNQDLLRIIEENWPEILDRYTLRGITPSYRDLSDKGLSAFRSGGVNVIHGTPGGRVLAPMGGGIMADKTSAWGAIAASHLVARVLRAEAEFEASRAGVESCLEREHAINKANLSFHAQLNADGALSVSEATTGITVWRERDGWLVATTRADS